MFARSLRCRIATPAPTASAAALCTRKFSTTGPAVGSVDARAASQRSLTLGLYRSVLSAAMAFGRSDFGTKRPLAHTNHAGSGGGSGTFSLPLLSHTDTYHGRWPQSVWLSLWRLKADRLSGSGENRAAVAAAMIEAEEAFRKQQKMTLNPARARLLVRSAFRARIKETDRKKIMRYSSDAFKVLRFLNTVKEYPPAPASEAVTAGCKVSVQSFFGGERDDTYYHQYQILIRNVTDEPITDASAPEKPPVLAPRTFRLESRRWSINDLSGNEHVVDGPGVVGQYPELAPGQSYRYHSQCPLGSPLGFMRGVFRFVDTSPPAAPPALPTGSTAVAETPPAAAPTRFEAVIAPFLLEAVERDLTAASDNSGGSIAGSGTGSGSGSGGGSGADKN